ncbi:site-2 protease family protein [Candidatus Acetothermia bacterium]|nr:site-2 protease family protein [Candidatus Acetothermia bacterium]MBI3643776.1 site-2 protease family protein [Candidatus Acetothermia bacterium]
MLQRGIYLGKILGIEIGLDYSWFLIFGLVTWTLSSSYTEFYPHWASQYPVWGNSVFWVVGLLTSLLFFSSVLAHEMGHSIVAIRTGLPVQSITLFLFGGVARIVREPSSPMQEFVIAIAGPIASLILGLLFWLLSITSVPDTPVQALADNLSYINLALAIFNMIPGFPLDGGRVLRAVLWKVFGDIYRATRIASLAGRGVGILFIAGGVTLALWYPEHLINGLWLGLIGWFLHNTAFNSQRQTLQRQILASYRVGDLAHSDLPQIESHITLDELVQEYLLKRGAHSVRVVQNGEFVGLITMNDVKKIPRAIWEMTRVSSAMTALHGMLKVDADESLAALYDRMSVNGVGQVLVVRGSEIIGVVTHGQLLGFLRTHAEMGSK